MPLNSTQHYSHTELTDFWDVSFNLQLLLKKKGKKSYTPGIFSLFHICSEVNKKGYRSREKKTQPHLTCWLLTMGMGRQMCFLCISRVWIVSLKSAAKLLSKQCKLINSRCSRCPCESICNTIFVNKFSWYSQLQTECVCAMGCVGILYASVWW